MEKCWLCEGSFSGQTELRTHLISSAHRRLTVLCPWCFGKERTFTRAADLATHVKNAYATLNISSEIFTIANSFYFSIYPSDYVRIVDKVSVYCDYLAYAARCAVQNWIESMGNEPKLLDKWNAGWKDSIEAKSQVDGRMDKQKSQDQGTEARSQRERKEEPQKCRSEGPVALQNGQDCQEGALKSTMKYENGKWQRVTERNRGHLHG
ncbi:hypothetical protein DPMN_120271 [Dreissena polymorpha]|uniref:C2H2-type domain-containing protein n=1 Tax=Dreissena polymorpha TaxID=45954 RepID=A0A9D4GNN1_DREPO|nr:hypothetical protein DPMN_120271 [Dreissena polymorpha]